MCTLCPIDSEFTVLNEMRDPYDDPRITLALEASVQALEISGGTAADGVVFEQGGRTRVVRGGLVVLAAHARFNPHILSDRVSRSRSWDVVVSSRWRTW